MQKMKSGNNPLTAKFTPYQVLVITILALTQFTVVLDFMVMSPLGDLLMKSLDLKTSEFGFAVSAYAFSAGVSGFLTAGFADRFDRKKLLLFFYVGFIAGTFACSLAFNHVTLIAARIVTGVFGGVIGSISLAIVADLFPLEQRGRVMGFMQMGFAASQVLGIPIGLYFANTWGWKAPFLMIVLLSVVIWITALIRLKPVNEHLLVQTDRSPLAHLWHTIAKRHYRIGFMATAFLSLGGFMMMPWGSVFAINNLGVTYGQLPLLFMLAGVGSLLIMPIIGRMSDRIDKFKLFTIASVCMIVVIIIYTHMSGVPFGVVLALNIILMMGIMSRMIPSMALVTSLPELKDRGAFMSINTSLQQIAGGIAAAVGGMVVVQKTKFSPLEHYDTLGFVITGLTIISVYLVYRVSRLVKKRFETTAKSVLSGP